MRKITTVLLALLCSSLFHPRVFGQEDSLRSQLATVERELETLVALAKKQDSPKLESVTRLLKDTRELMDSMAGGSSTDEMILVEMKFLEFEDGTDDTFFFGREALQVPRPIHALKNVTDEELEALVSRSSNVVAAPKVLAIAGTEAAIDIVDEQDYAFLERDDDGRYSMHTVKAKERIELKVNASHLGSNEPPPPHAKVMASDYGPDQPAPIHIRMRAAIDRVLGRSPCTKNARQVGMPIVGKAAKELELVIVENRWVAARLPLPGSKQEGIVLVLRASSVK